MPKVRVEQINYPYIILSGDTGTYPFYLGKLGYVIKGSSGITVDVNDGIIEISGSGSTTPISSIPGLGLEYNDITVKIDASISSGLTFDNNKIIILEDTNEIRNSIDVSNNGVKSGSLFVEIHSVSETGITIHDTGVSITYTPSGDGYVSISLNGLEYEVTDDTSGAFFFGTGISSPLSHEYIVSGITLYFNPVVADFNLDVDDEIILKYTRIN
jgi:hypothetical protein